MNLKLEYYSSTVQKGYYKKATKHPMLNINFFIR